MIKAKATSIKSGKFAEMTEPVVITKRLGKIAAVLVPVSLPADATREQVKAATIKMINQWGELWTK